MLSLALITTPAGTWIPGEVGDQVCSGVWAVETSGRAKNAVPIAIGSRELSRFGLNSTPSNLKIGKESNQ